MEVPSWFLKELHEFDPDLRLRWSRRLELWQIERRVTRGLHPGTILCDGWRDDYIRARDGYLLVASVPPNKLGRHIFVALRNSDLWANGGWEKIAQQIEDREAAEEKAKEAEFSNDVEAISKELFDFWAVRDGRMVFNSSVVN